VSRTSAHHTGAGRSHTSATTAPTAATVCVRKLRSACSA
jgi:hypothetical protein